MRPMFVVLFLFIGALWPGAGAASLVGAAGESLVEEGLDLDALRYGDARSVAVAGSDAFVVFRKGEQAFVSRSTDGGLGWQEPVLLGSGVSFSPAIAENGQGELDFFYVSGPHFFHRRFAEGILSPPHLIGEAQSVSFGNGVVSGDKVHAFGSLGKEFAYFMSKDGGESWSEAQVLYRSDFTVSYSAAWGEGEKVVAVFRLNRTGGNELYFVQSLDGGRTWSQAREVSGGLGVSDTFSIGVAGGRIWVAFAGEKEGGVSSFVVDASDSGATWSAPARLGSVGGSELGQSVGVDGNGNIFVGWFDVLGRRAVFKQYLEKSGTWTAERALVEGFASYPEFEARGKTGSLGFVFQRGASEGTRSLYFNTLQTHRQEGEGGASVSISGLGSVRAFSESMVLIDVESLDALALDAVARVKVIYKNQEIFSQTFNVEGLSPFEQRAVSSNIFRLDEPGTYSVTVELLQGENTLLDSKNALFDVTGDLIFDVTILPSANIGLSDRSIPVTLEVENRGDYYQDILLMYWGESQDGKIFSTGETPVAVKPGAKRRFDKSLLLPDSLEPGKYYLRAKVVFADMERTSRTTFFVEEPPTAGLASLAGFAGPSTSYAVLALVLVLLFLFFRNRGSGRTPPIPPIRRRPRVRLRRPYA